VAPEYDEDGNLIESVKDKNLNEKISMNWNF
jgi:hypothetical protein